MIVIVEVRVPALRVALHVALHVVPGRDHQLSPVWLSFVNPHAPVAANHEEDEEEEDRNEGHDEDQNQRQRFLFTVNMILRHFWLWQKPGKYQH